MLRLSHKHSPFPSGIRCFPLWQLLMAQQKDLGHLWVIQSLPIWLQGRNQHQSLPLLRATRNLLCATSAAQSLRLLPDPTVYIQVQVFWIGSQPVMVWCIKSESNLSINGIILYLFSTAIYQFHKNLGFNVHSRHWPSELEERDIFKDICSWMCLESLLELLPSEFFCGPFGRSSEETSRTVAPEFQVQTAKEYEI